MVKAITRAPGSAGYVEVEVAQVYATQATSNASGIATVVFPTGRFSSAPSVQSSPTGLGATATQATVCETIAVTATQATFRTYRTQSQSIVVGGTTLPVLPAANVVIDVWASPLQ